MMFKRELLLPWPKRVDELPGAVVLGRSPRVELHGVVRAAAATERLIAALSERGLSPSIVGRAGTAADIRVHCEASLGLPDEGYELVCEGSSIVVRASSDAGAFYGVCTLAQLILLAPSAADGLRLPALRIEDAPDFPARGVMLDVSRDRVPQMTTLLALLDKLASFKINQVQLYMEHTFAYAAHEQVWRNASPFTGPEIRELDRYARERFIELVPNQNSFGHMARWLTIEAYRGLAECPDGFEHSWNPTREPYGLCATDPKSLSFLDDLYAELLPNFSSSQLNVGLDETIDLGLGRSAEACLERGTERVYLEFLQRIHGLVRSRGRRMQFWGDIINKRPELIPELPPDAVALEWGYEADHPFLAHAERFRASNLAFYVCPGTSSWNSIAGRSENAVLNICRAAQAGHAHGAAGVLTTDWGDNGHLQPLPVSYLGFIVGALVSWNVQAARSPAELPLAAMLDAHVFRDASGTLGQIAYDLGQAYSCAGAVDVNTSLLFSLLTSRDAHYDAAKVSAAGLAAARELVSSARDSLSRVRASAPDAALVNDEFRWCADALEFSCLLGQERLTVGFAAPFARIDATRRFELARQLGGLLEQHTKHWLARSRPGGLRDSRRRLENTLQKLVAP
jgi:hexosaminidase